MNKVITSLDSAQNFLTTNISSVVIGVSFPFLSKCVDKAPCGVSIPQ